MPKIAALANLNLLPQTEEAIAGLSESPVDFPRDEGQPGLELLVERAGDAEVVLVGPGTPVPAAFFEARPGVRYVGICGTARENVDLAAVERRGIALTNVIDYGDEPTAEFVFMQLVTLARGMGPYQWRDWPTELMAKRIGIIGLGALGSAVANLALGYKMDVRYFSRTRKPAQEALGIEYLDKDELLATSEIIVITTPSNTLTIDAREFELVQPNTIIVQASMGDCVEREAFLEWIAQDGNHAVFDFSAGMSSYQAYHDLPRVTFPKVVAGHTVETRQRLGDRVVQHLHEHLGGA